MCKDECTRHKEFCQLRKEIRGSRDYLVVGIDVAKQTHYAFFGTATGETLRKRLIFENTEEGFQKLLQCTELIRSKHSLTKLVFGLEPTGNYHKPLGSYLLQKDYAVVLVSGEAAKSNRKLLDGRWDKHDTKCAANIADLITQGKCQFYERAHPRIQALRDLLSLRKRFKREEHRVKTRIRNTLIAKHFPELDHMYKKSECDALAITRWCLDPRKIAGLDYDDFARLITKSRKSVMQERRLREIHAQASHSIGCEVVSISQYEARVLVETLQAIRATIAENEKRLGEVGRQLPGYELLKTIPGFGPYVTAVVLSTIGDPQRFSCASQVVRMAGYDLCADRSGQRSAASVPVISKKGNATLRYALYQAALIATTRNPHFVRYFHNKLRGREREKGIKTKLRVKIAAKLLIIAWILMKKQTVFDPACICIPEDNLNNSNNHNDSLHSGEAEKHPADVPMSQRVRP